MKNEEERARAIKDLAEDVAVHLLTRLDARVHLVAVEYARADGMASVEMTESYLSLVRLRVLAQAIANV